MADCFLSMVFPAHNEEERLPHALEHAMRFLQSQPYPSEIIVVENGSTDRTLQVAEGYARENPIIRVIHEAEPGKGLAIRRGMLEAAGEYRFFLDVDLAMPITEVIRFLPPAMEDVAIVIASREAPGAVRYNEPEYRHLTGRVFNWLVRTLALPGIQDSQCGFKCFRRDAAEALFPHQTIMGWSFDVELLFIARRLGYAIVELPIPWYFNPDSRVKVLRDSWRMLRDLLAIRRNGRRGVYPK